MFLLVGYFFACQYLCILANEQIKETELENKNIQQ